MSWQREYRSTVSTFMYVFLGSVFLFMGVVFTFLVGTFGLALLTLAVIVPAVVRYLRRDLKVTCSDLGFVVCTDSTRYGRSEQAYAWGEVTDTGYYQSAHKDPEGFAYTVGHFAVDTVRGTAFAVNHKIRGFAELVETFNTMAPQIPYVWKPSGGAYVCVDRNQAEAT